MGIQTHGNFNRMRNSKHFAATASQARELFAIRPVFALAGVGRSGQPVLRSLHGVVLGDALYWHGAPAGEKEELEGSEVVAGAEEVVAEIPSHFIDPENACPATTLYRSAQARGTVSFVADPVEKAAALQALMRKLQPEGGHLPIRAQDPVYRAAVKGIRIAKLPLDEVTGKFKLAQNKPDAVFEGIVAGLWRRGTPRDLRALDLLLSMRPEAQRPPSMRAPEGYRCLVAPSPSRADEVAELLEGQYWTQGTTAAARRLAHLQSAAWVVLLDGGDRVVASARAVSDRVRFAAVFDVVVRPESRRRGLGRSLMGLLLEHPALRETRSVFLRTRDAERFYESLGFVRAESFDRGLPFSTIRMVKT